jgi:hypothetical protein
LRRWQQPHRTMNRILIGLTLIIFFQCDGTKSTTLPENQPTKHCGQFQVDTVSILTNKNLDRLISKVETTELTVYSQFNSTPSFVKEFLKRLIGTKFRIADQGEEWQATDVVQGDLPDRQLVYLGVGQDVMLLAYNKGGIGVSERILIIHFEQSCIKDFWCGGVLTELTDKNQIVNHLKENKDKHWGLNTNIIYL